MTDMHEPKAGSTPARTPRRRRLITLVRRRGWLVIPVGLALLIAWVRVWSPVRVDSVRVERGTVIDEAFGRGTVESEREADVGFDLSGRLSDVLVDEGARVTLGQELARLETVQAAADLRTAQVSVLAARSSLRRLAADEERVRAVLATAERDARRTEALLAKGAIAGQENDEAADRVRIARADLDRVLAQRSEATRGIDVAAGGAEQRRVAMVRASLLAPFDGLITRRLRESGDTVTIGSTVFRLVDTERVHVSASIDETVLPLLAVDQPSTILFPGSTAPIRGRVSKVSWEADRQTHELIVEVTPEPLQRHVAIGQRADVRIELSRRERVLSIPMRMIHHDATGPFVYIDHGGKIAIARPRFGLTGRDLVEVIDGLREGDVVLGAPGAATSLPVGRRWEAM